jgi:hypothetical protein
MGGKSSTYGEMRNARLVEGEEPTDTPRHRQGYTTKMDLK